MTVAAAARRLLLDTKVRIRAWNSSPARLELPKALKSLRGGAFDTYFHNHAACQFQSGEIPLARKHNIGFRCAVSVRDLASTWKHGGAREPQRNPVTSVASLDQE